MLTVQFLKGLSTTVVLKKLTPRGRHRWSGGNPISFSLPRHGARERTETQNRIKTRKEKPRVDCKLAQKKYRIKKNYMMHEQIKCHDACPNAIQLSSNQVQIHKIGLSIEFLTKTPKI